MAVMSAHGIVSQVVMFANPPSLKTIVVLGLLYCVTATIWKSYGMVSISTAALPCQSRASIRKPPTPDLAALNETCASLFAHDAVCERYMTEFLS